MWESRAGVAGVTQGKLGVPNLRSPAAEIPYIADDQF